MGHPHQSRNATILNSNAKKEFVRVALKRLTKIVGAGSPDELGLPTFPLGHCQYCLPYWYLHCWSASTSWPGKFSWNSAGYLGRDDGGASFRQLEPGPLGGWEWISFSTDRGRDPSCRTPNTEMRNKAKNKRINGNQSKTNGRNTRLACTKSKIRKQNKTTAMTTRGKNKAKA